MSWKDLLRPASFKGVRFRVDTSATAGGRRGMTFEFPKRDDPADEDLGRRARRWSVTGWVIGEDYTYQAAALEAVLNEEGAGLLILPSMGEQLVRCETYTRSERRTEGGLATFDMSFTEAGEDVTTFITEATEQTVERKAEGARTETTQALDNAPISV